MGTSIGKNPKKTMGTSIGKADDAMAQTSQGHALYGSSQEDGGHHRGLQRAGPGGGQSLGGAGMAGRHFSGKCWEDPWEMQENVSKIYGNP